MHSPGVYSGHVTNIRRCSPFRYPASRSPEREATPASNKILQSILDNFTQSGSYLNGSRNNDVGSGECRDRCQPLAADGVGVESAAVRAAGGGRHCTCDDVCRQQVEIASPVYGQPTHRALLYMAAAASGSQANPGLSRYYQGPSSTVTSSPSPPPATAVPQQQQQQQQQQHYMQLYQQDDYSSTRNRSSSLGSTGSSLRESRSPSDDSVASRDSVVSRYSPVSCGSSPSPSPPAHDSCCLTSCGTGGGSKLLGILKGGSYPVSSYYGFGKPAWPVGGRPLCSTTRTRTPILKRRLSNDEQLDDEQQQQQLDMHSCYQVVDDDDVLAPCQDEPIDLSCKAKRARHESADGPIKSPSVDSGWGSDYLTTSSPIDDADSAGVDVPTESRSILASILCGRVTSASSSASSSVRDSPRCGSPVRAVECGVMVPSPTADSPDSPSLMLTPSPLASMPASPVSSVSSHASSAVRATYQRRQRVTLAKKNLLPVSARVSDWLLKMVTFAKTRAEFSGLPEADKVTLIQHCWTRLMLLYMAETNFQFAVTPVYEDMDTSGRPPAITGIDPTEPTMDSVELVQNFIRKCQLLQVDSEEYRCLRMYILFHPGCSGLENVDFVERISSSARQALQDYVSRTHPADRLRYSELLLCLHSLFGVNCGMVQTLFCKHVAADMDQHVKDMMLRCDAFAGSESDSDSGSESAHVTVVTSPAAAYGGH